MKSPKTLTPLRELLAGEMSFLLEEGGFAVAESEASGMGAYVVLRAQDLECRLLNERDRIFLEFRSRQDKRARNWISTDILQGLLEHEHADDARLDSTTILFVRNHLPEIVAAFSGRNLKRTLATVARLERERSRRVFRK